MIRTLVGGGINWTWYLCAEFDESNKTAHIYYHDRWHNYDYRGSNHPKHEHVGFTIIESDGRIARMVKVKEIEYTVTNPAGVFSYHDMSVYVSE
jgi:hypothetical protein